MCTVFLSYPMNGKTEKEMKEIRDEMIKMLPEGLNWIDNSDCKGEETDGRLHYLGEAIKKMDKADMVMFHRDWQRARGCHIEMEVARAYNIPIIDIPGESYYRKPPVNY